MDLRTPLFSTYRQGENRVTGSVLAVFQRIDSGHVARLLGESVGESELPFVSFTNQAAASRGSVPDAEISANFQYLFEVKTTANAVRKSQLEGHLKHMKSGRQTQRLFVLTPDAGLPKAIAELKDQRIAWLNFRSLDNALQELLADRTELLSEREQFLLRELHYLFEHEGLLEHRDTVIIAARIAYPDYFLTHAYVCQPARPFRSGLERLGFYAEGKIQREVPKILHREDNVIFSTEEARTRARRRGRQTKAIGKVIEKLLKKGRIAPGEAHQVFVLTAPEADETMRLSAPITNTKVDKNGKPWAWTMGQGYVAGTALQEAKTTTELDNVLRSRRTTGT